jgi:membrane protease subunit HflC
MKRNTLTLTVGALLILIFVLLLFTFQVRQTQTAVVTTFDRPTRFIETPGLRWKWPYPIQEVYKFDKRVHNFEEKFEETLTSDSINLLVRLFIGWTITDPQKFFTSFPRGESAEAEPILEGLIRNHKNAIVGQHPFSHFISADGDRLKLAEIEAEILRNIQPAAQTNYGIKIQFLGVKKLGLPESVTEKVFNRMKAERQREIDRLQAQGEARAIEIRSGADSKRDQIIAEARGRASELRGEAQAEANQHLKVLEQNPALANFLMEVDTLEQSLREKATIVVDERTRPFNLLLRQPGGSMLQTLPTQPAAPSVPAAKLQPSDVQ